MSATTHPAGGTKMKAPMSRKLTGHVRSNASRLLAAAVVGVGLAGGSIAYAVTAAHPSGLIHGCYSKTGGGLRIAARCRSGELPITWSHTGPAGKRGPTGKAGPAGPA